MCFYPVSRFGRAVSSNSHDAYSVIKQATSSLRYALQSDTRKRGGGEEECERGSHLSGECSRARRVNDRSNRFSFSRKHVLSYTLPTSVPPKNVPQRTICHMLMCVLYLSRKPCLLLSVFSLGCTIRVRTCSSHTPLLLRVTSKDRRRLRYHTKDVHASYSPRMA